MKNNLLCLGLLSWLSVASPAFGADEAKEKRIARLTDLVADIAKREASIDQEELLKLLNELELMEVARFAVISHAMGWPGDAEDKDYDRRWYRGFYVSLTAIEIRFKEGKITREQAREALDFIQHMVPADAHVGERFHEMEERFK